MKSISLLIATGRQSNASNLLTLSPLSSGWIEHLLAARAFRVCYHLTLLLSPLWSRSNVETEFERVFFLYIAGSGLRDCKDDNPVDVN